MYLIYDTETISENLENEDVNIHDHHPFLLTYIVADKKFNIISQGIINLLTGDDTPFKDALKQCDTIVGANIKYDVHMMLNYGYDESLFIDKHYIDVQVLARLCINHDKQSESFSVALKKLAVQYLGIDSNEEERKLKSELSHLQQEHKQKMKDYFIQQGVWINTTKTKETTILNDVYTDTWFKVYQKYPQFKPWRKKFFELYPRPNYSNCSNVYKYAMTDTELTYKLFKLWYPRIPGLKQTGALIRTSEATFPLIKMERNGLTIDLKKLINDRNIILKELSKIKIISPINGEEITINQNARLKEIYEFESGKQLNSADKNARNEILELSPTAKLVDYGTKLAKYLNSYISRILSKMSYVNGEWKIYTQYKMSGTVTGRLSSDFQQFPKEPLELQTGDIINIRSWFPVPKDYKYLFYFDYSQLELRLQCEWTNLINGHPDLNMTRAFMPYNCIESNGKYYLQEDPNIEWQPTDLHASTAKHAFPQIKQDDPEFSHYRKLGKRCNFACNYGASPAKIAESLKIDFATAKKLVDGYKKTFKGVVDFGNWIQKRVYSTNEFPNLFKRYYYSTNKHQLQNWLVQGSGADLLLIKLKETFEYLKTHPWWTYVITVHDEIGFSCKDIPIDQLKKEIKEIQSLMKYSLSAVDVIADVEYTTTDWGHKLDYEEEKFLNE